MIKANKLIHSSILSSSGTLVKILSAMLCLKIIAIFSGPKGVALIGQFMSLANIFTTLAGGGITFGLIKYVAEYAHTDQLKDFLSTALIYTLFFSLLTMILGLIFTPFLAQWALASTSFSYLIRSLALAQFFIALHLLICSILNGLGQIRLQVFINIIASLLSLIIIALVAMTFPLKIILLSFIGAQAMAILISLSLVYRQNWFPYLFSWQIKKKHWSNLMRYSLMSTISTLTVPMAQVFVRNDLNQLFGWETVGYWQAVIRLSDAYILFVTTALTTYYLPRLSQLKTSQTLKQEIAYTYKTLLPLIGFILLLIYLCRDLIIHVLYSEHFAPASQLFTYQLLGDFFRIASWLFTYLLLAKAWTKTYVLTELLLSCLFFCLSYFFSRRFGLIGATYAFACTYFIYWLLMASISFGYFQREERLDLACKDS